MRNNEEKIMILIMIIVFLLIVLIFSINYIKKKIESERNKKQKNERDELKEYILKGDLEALEQFCTGINGYEYYKIEAIRDFVLESDIKNKNEMLLKLLKMATDNREKNNREYIINFIININLWKEIKDDKKFENYLINYEIDKKNQIQIADFYLEEGNKKEALKWYKKAGMQGSKESLRKMAFILEKMDKIKESEACYLCIKEIEDKESYFLALKNNTTIHYSESSNNEFLKGTALGFLGGIIIDDLWD